MPKFSLLSCTAAPKEKLEILIGRVKPITKISKLTKEQEELISQLEISDEQQQLLKDLVNKGRILFKNFENINPKEKILLSKIKGMTILIDKDFINQEKMRMTSENLKKLIEKCDTESAAIDWKHHLSLLSQSSTSPEISLVASGQSPKLAEIKALKHLLNPINKEDTQENNQPKSRLQSPISPEVSAAASTTLAEIIAMKHQLKATVTNELALEPNQIVQANQFANIKLNQVTHDRLIPSYGIEMSEELAKKLANQHAKIETATKDNSLANPPGISATASVPIQNSSGISLFQQQLQIQATKLKPVNKINIQENASDAKQGSNQAIFVLKPNNLVRNKLKSVQNLIIETKKEKASELDKLSAKGKEIFEKNNLTTENVTFRNSVCSTEEEKLEYFEFMERVCDAIGFFDNESDKDLIFRNTLSQIIEDTTIDELDKSLKDSQGVCYESETECIRSSQAPVSLHFKLVEDKPKIVHEILKPMVKL